MKVREIMKPAEVLPPDASISEAAKVIKDWEINMVPIGTSEHIQGVVTPHDIAVSAVADPCRADATPVEEITTPVMGFCQEDQDVTDVLKAMRSYHQTRLLVRNGNGEIIGVISLDDIFHTAPVAELARAEA